LVALSSTISTGKPPSTTGGWAAAVSGGCGWSPKRAVNAKVLPWPGTLSTLIPPPIKATRREAMVRPRPVPSYLRVVKVSPCSNARKIRSCFSGGMPMPVSVTAKRSRPSPSGAGSAALSTSNTTSPRSVNLMALPTR